MSEEIIFQIILHGGNARSSAMEAIESAKNHSLDEAEKKLEEATEEMNHAHQIQTNLIQKEAGGSGTHVTLLLAHAQDHFMSAMTVRDLAKEFVELYRRLNRGEEGNSK